MTMYVQQIGFQFVEAVCPICDRPEGYLEVFRHDEVKRCNGEYQTSTRFSAWVSCTHDDCYLRETDRIRPAKGYDNAVAAAKEALRLYREWGRELDDKVAAANCKILRFPTSVEPMKRAGVGLAYYDLDQRGDV